MFLLVFEGRLTFKSTSHKTSDAGIFVIPLRKSTSCGARGAKVAKDQEEERPKGGLSLPDDSNGFLQGFDAQRARQVCL